MLGSDHTKLHIFEIFLKELKGGNQASMKIEDKGGETGLFFGSDLNWEDQNMQEVSKICQKFQ